MFYLLKKFRNPLEVSEEFVLQFNSAKDLSEIEKLEEMARKMLERAKVSIITYSTTNDWWNTMINLVMKYKI